MTGEPFRDREGRPVRLAGTLLDVTERRRAEVELRRQSLLFDSLADAVVVVGSDGTILDWSASAERLLGWRKAETLGRCPGALLRPGDEGRLDEALMECARHGGRRSEELTLKGKSGLEVPVDMVAVPLNSREEGLVACVAVFGISESASASRRGCRWPSGSLPSERSRPGWLTRSTIPWPLWPLTWTTSRRSSRELRRTRSPPRGGQGGARRHSKGRRSHRDIVRDLQAFSGRLRPDCPVRSSPTKSWNSP